MLSCLGIHQLAQGALLLMGDIGPLWWDNEAFLTTCCSKHSSLWMCQQIHNDILDTIAPFILSFSTDVMQPVCEYWQATPNSRQDLTVQCPVANFLSLQLPLALGPSSLPAALFASCSPCSLPGTLFALLKPPQAVRLWTIAAYDGGREGWFWPHMWSFCESAASAQRANSVSSCVVAAMLHSWYYMSSTERWYCSFLSIVVEFKHW